MKRDLRFVLISLLFVVLFAGFTIGQETTGAIDVIAKDEQGAVVPGVAITVTSTGGSTAYKRTQTTDDSGSVRFVQVPPGMYSVSAAAVKGFAAKTLSGLEVGLGRTTAVNFPMTISATGAEVNVTIDEVPAIDVQKTNVETTINSQLAELLPKGQNFSSILKVNPATRPESRSGQFQIDGASGSENTFIVDGQEVTNVLSGVLDQNTNLPLSQLQEVQVKSSGFEAEYGGATGGVVNVVTKGGGNELRGEFGVNLRTSRLEPKPGYSLRSNNGTPEYYPNRRDQYNETNPTANLGGLILKDRIYFFATYAPQIFTRQRTLVFLDGNRVPTGRVETYHAKQRKEATFGRLDGQVTDKLRLTGTINWNPITQTGITPGYSNELGNIDGAAYYDQTGGRQNSMNFTGSGTYLLTNNLIVTGRAGHYFLNEKLGSYGIPSIGPPRIVCSSSPFSPVNFPTGFGCTRTAPNNNNGVTQVANTEYDVTTRNQYDADATYEFGFGGRHQLKGGFQYSEIGNKVIYGQTDLITLRSGSTGLATVGNYAGRALPSTPGAIGSGKLSTFRTRGNVSSTNTGLYVQDKWQPIKRLTLNLGVRGESEDVPSYAPGLPGMSFNWGSKIAPRFGAAYDLTGDGKTKVTAFFGIFYDRFKLTLPRGSFGGDEFHDVFFEFFPGDTINTINRDLILGAGVSPLPGGACPLNQVAPIYGRVRCDIDFRVSSNSGGPLTEVGGIDPNIKPFTQRELTFSFQRLLSKNYVFSARYTRKQVLHAIEDAGFPNSQGSEYYIIGNPGEGLYKQQADMFGTLAPKPQRDYDALELRVDRSFADNFFFQANYTFSRLYGNYGGLASSDEEGRTDPNVNRYFDQPHAGFTVAGGPDNGRLATDRPHVFKFFGAYSLGWDKFGLWKSNSTDFEVFTTATSGSVITTFVDINNISQIILTRRGDQGRTPVFTQTDLALHHNIKFGRDGRFTLKLDADVINALNQYIVLNKGLNPSGQGGNVINTQNFNPLDTRFNLITPAQTAACNANPATTQQCQLITAYKTFQLQGSPELLALAQAAQGHNPFYNLPSSYQGKRTVRYGIRLLF